MNLTIAYLEIIMLLPLVVGIIFFLIPERIRSVKGIVAFIVSAVVLFYTIKLYFLDGANGTINLIEAGFLNKLGVSKLPVIIGSFAMINIDNLARFILVLTGFFTVIILLYSLFYLKGKNHIKHYYSIILITLWASVCTILSDSLFMFIFFWGILGLTLYKLIKCDNEESSAAAKKTFIIIGASDGIMILGIGILWKITGYFNITELSVRTSDAIRISAFLALMIGSFAKAGAFPFHTWVPDYTKNAPASSSAYLPASLDKLLGIYFMYRICCDIFVLNQWMVFILLVIGALSIIIGGMMALVQNNYKKLLGYCAVSQVGYIIIGMGLGTTLGILGGLFHMLNHTLYKSGLFLVAGSVEKRTGLVNLIKTRGLSRLMPITFVAATIFALSVSGIPPLNGFASKWIIYQSIIDFGKSAGISNQLWIIWLAVALLGSSITLAYMIKFISGIFLEKAVEKPIVKEVHFTMWLPMIILVLCCIGIGVFASSYIVPFIFKPIIGDFHLVGVWDSSSISLLIVLSILIGIIFYFLSNVKKFRTSDSFIGGEKPSDELGYPVDSYYNTIYKAPVLKDFYRWAEKKYFDIYDISKDIVLKISHLFSAAHNGILSNLAFWVLAGLIFMFIFLLM